MTFDVSPDFMIPLMCFTIHKVVSAYDVTSAMLSSWYETLTAMVPPLHYSLMGNMEKMNAVGDHSRDWKNFQEKDI